LNLTAQYWTSRGYAYVHVNYAGSTGYGRAYQESLNYFWGIKDVDDSASCVDYLAGKGLVDGAKVGIVGCSSGGYTVLQSLVTYPKLYAAGNSSYGIGNLKLLETGTHKFESHYLFGLLFPEWTSKEEQDRIYSERSPAQHAAKIESPLLLLHGEEDRVVPIDQTIEMEKILREGGRDVHLVVFKGEGHGFRMQENVKKATEEEEKLWRRTLVG
jgi:dipeptidyl aminopeptidase/acylaminoacyl peptidase